jgi:ribosomal protein S13
MSLVKVEGGNASSSSSSSSSVSSNAITAVANQVSSLTKAEIQRVSFELKDKPAVLNVFKQIIDNANGYQNCCKDIHFMMNSTSYSGARVPLKLHVLGYFTDEEKKLRGNGPLTAADIREADSLVVGTKDVEYDPNQVHVVKQVKILFNGFDNQVVSELILSSGKPFLLHDGYSIVYCGQLRKGKVRAMQLKGTNRDDEA